MARRFRGGERLTNHTVTFVIDGVPGQTAFMMDPYEDGTRGVVNYAQARLFRLFDRLTERGFRLYALAAGDHGIERAISAFEHADQTGRPLRPDARHTIAHLDHIRPIDIKRMAALDIWGQIQPHWMGNDPFDRATVLPNVGDERFYFEKNEYTRLRDAGIRLAAGADWPTGPVVSPWTMIQIGATGQWIPDTLPPRTTPFEVENLIEMFTINGAAIQFMDEFSGSLEVGKRADLIVIDRNVLEIPIDEIAQTQVLLTMLDGDPVYGGTNFEKVVESGDIVDYSDYEFDWPYEDAPAGRFIPGRWRIIPESPN